MNRDKLSSVPCVRSVTLGYALLNTLQEEQAPNQLMGVASLLVVMCDSAGIRASELLQLADNMLKDQEKQEVLNEHRPVRALRQYVREDFGHLDYRQQET